MTDGNSEEAARGGGSDEEAAWLDLIGRFDAPAGSPDAPAPWPDRENLGPPAPPGDSTTSENLPQRGPGERTAPGDGLGEQRFGEPRPGEPGPDEGSPEAHRFGERRLGEHGPDKHEPDKHRLGEHGLGERRGPGADGPADGAARDSERWPSAGDPGPWPADTDATWPSADADGTSTGRSTRWPPAGDATAAGEDPAGDGPGTGLLPGAGPASDGRFVLPGHRSLDLPSPAGPRSWSAPDEDDEEHYTPPPPPPLPTLAPGAKAAWTGLFGGPGYLLVATLAGWSVPGWALFLAIAAFVGGFTVLVLRQGDRPDDDSGPDDGAVV